MCSLCSARLRCPSNVASWGSLPAVWITRGKNKTTPDLPPMHRGERKTEENNIYGEIKRKGWCQTENRRVSPPKHRFYLSIGFVTASESLKARGESKIICEGSGEETVCHQHAANTQIPPAGT